MINGNWKDPNFEFEASDIDGQTHRHITFANSEAELRQRLELKRLTVQSVTNYDFSEWQERASRATEEAIEAYTKSDKSFKFKTSIWGQLKWHLFELFHGKCAYCELKALIGAAGDVEHYRPKGGVKEDPTHPGYYWLAYEVSNLLPACEKCNRARGKSNQFPVKRNAHAHNATDLAHEQPLLLNPYDAEDPRKHLEFTEFGTVIERSGSERGKESVRAYHLNRPGLPDARLQAQSNIQQEWGVRALGPNGFNFGAAFRELRNELLTGTREYSAAMLDELERHAEEQTNEMWNSD